MPATMEMNLVGQTVDGRYLIGEIVGEGGMGVVYKATDTRLGRTVAVKITSVKALSTDVDQSVLRRVRERELRAMVKVSHQNCVALYDVGQFPDGRIYLVMEYVNGKGLDERIRKKGTLPVEEIVEIASQILLGLETVHRQNIVHRDLKPSNILVVESGDGRPLTAKLMDFGVSKPFGEEQTEVESGDGPVRHLTMEGSVCGTPAYMSPEHLGGKPLDGRSDLFELGIVMYEMAHGITPLEQHLGSQLNSHDVRVVTRQYLLATEGKLLKQAQNLPRPLLAFIDRLTRPKPEDRFSAAREAYEELQLVKARLRKNTPSPEELPTVHEMPATPPGLPPVSGGGTAAALAAVQAPRRMRALVGGVVGPLAVIMLVVALVHHSKTNLATGFPAAMPTTASVPAPPSMKNLVPAPRLSAPVATPSVPATGVVPGVLPILRMAALEQSRPRNGVLDVPPPPPSPPVHHETAAETRGSHPRNADAARELFYQLRRAGKREEACKALSRALRLTPKGKRAEMHVRLNFNGYCP